MAHKIKSLLCHKLASVLATLPSKTSTIGPSTIVPFIKTVCEKNGTFEYKFNCDAFVRSMSISEKILSTPENYINQMLDNCNAIDAVEQTSINSRTISVSVHPKDAANEVINKVLDDRLSWKRSPLLETINPLKVVVEFSSPNIAKPFHVGHLRSTLVGNFIANINESVGHQVTRINYLGDWGTQFGLLVHAYNESGTTEADLEIDPIAKLYALYVSINKRACKDSTLPAQARRIFAEMEAGNEEHLRKWRLFSDLSIKSLIKAYAAMNIVFDRYEGESMYEKKCHPVLDALRAKGKLTDSDGRLVYQMASAQVTLLKSDGSTLYLTRDLAAALERFQTYEFDRMLYVVESNQHDHFDRLKCILRDLNPTVSDRIRHIKFGRINGMSTRKGTAVFLSDLMQEAKMRTLAMQKESVNSKAEGDTDTIRISDVLAPSALIFSCLNKKKSRSYHFNWKDALRLDRGGSYLQYAHCRLCNLEENCGYSFNPEASCDLLVDPIAVDLIATISKFDEIIYESYETNDSSLLSEYLTTLCTRINRAYLVLPVKMADKTEAESRLKLFRAARITLSEGMKILGLRPINKM